MPFRVTRSPGHPLPDGKPTPHGDIGAKGSLALDHRKNPRVTIPGVFLLMLILGNR